MNRLWRLAHARDEDLAAEAHQVGLTREQAEVLREIVNYLRSCSGHPDSPAWARVYAARAVLRGATPAEAPPRSEAPTPRPTFDDSGPMGQTKLGAAPRGPATPFRGTRQAPPARSALEPVGELGQTAPMTRPHRDAPLPFGRGAAAPVAPPSAPSVPPTPPPPVVVAAAPIAPPFEAAPAPAEAVLPWVEAAPVAAAPPSFQAAPSSVEAAPSSVEAAPSSVEAAPSSVEAAPQAAPRSVEATPPSVEAAPRTAAPATSSRPARASFAPDTIAQRMRAAGASERDIASFLSALQPPPPDDEEEVASG